VCHAVTKLGAVVALKGRETLIAAPASGNVYCNRAGNVGLATSGSGDTLSGVITGLAARGSTPFQAAVWGVYLHARAGDALARRMGSLGFLARELLAEIPPLMAKLCPTGKG
jgi:NAD(P)H-hydrate repair Nnr-like enzyme with NAD(P)H-hydrate dehydratase domain